MSRSSHGLIIIYTGDGKGKTTAALGLALRALGYNMRVCMIQFVKGSWFYGELEGCKRLAPNFELISAGKGFVGIIDDKSPRSDHIKAAEEALKISREKISSNTYDIIILDEINYAIKLNLISQSDLLDLLKTKPENLTIILTGNYAPKELIEMADLVTEMRSIKHPYDKGMTARRGIDF